MSAPRPLQLLNTTDSTSLPSPVLSPVRPSTNIPRRQSSISYAPNRRTSLHLDLSSNPVTVKSPVLSPPASATRNAPATLAEKHADLLHFIAQKESKCLDLRQQLAQHESELLTLKRKWERIVLRSSASPSQPSSPFLQNRSPLSQTPESSVPTSPLTQTKLNRRSMSVVGSPTEVLGGIRDGVQSGLGKIWGGLGEILDPGVTSPIPPPSAALKRESSQHRHSTLSESSLSSSASSDAVRLSVSSNSSVFDEGSTEEKEGDEAVVEEEDDTLKMSTRARVPTDEDSKEKAKSFKFPATPPATSPRPARPATRVARGAASASISASVASWMPTGLNRKLEEISKSERFAQSQKRASVLLNDVSNSFFAALGPLSGVESAPATSAPTAPCPRHHAAKASVSSKPEEEDETWNW